MGPLTKWPRKGKRLSMGSAHELLFTKANLAATTTGCPSISTLISTDFIWHHSQGDQLATWGQAGYFWPLLLWERQDVMCGIDICLYTDLPSLKVMLRWKYCPWTHRTPPSQLRYSSQHCFCSRASLHGKWSAALYSCSWMHCSCH